MAIDSNLDQGLFLFRTLNVLSQDGDKAQNRLNCSRNWMSSFTSDELSINPKKNMLKNESCVLTFLEDLSFRHSKTFQKLLTWSRVSGSLGLDVNIKVKANVKTLITFAVINQSGLITM